MILSPASRAPGLRRDVIHGLRSLCSLHPGLLSVVASRLVEANIRLDSFESQGLITWRHPTKRWTGATGSVFRIIIGPAQLLGNAVARSTQPSGGKSRRGSDQEERSMSDINDWLQETKAHSGLISEGYRLELSRLWCANLMFVVIPAVLSTAAAIFAALPRDTAGHLAVGTLSLPLASVFAGGAAILMAIHKALRCDEYQAECLRLAQLHQSIAISAGSALSRPEDERTAYQERIAAKLEKVTEGAKARLPTRIMSKAERRSGVKFYAQSDA